MEPKYWKSLEELAGGPKFRAEAETEFPSNPLQEIEPGHSRRGFLKAAGFTFAGAALTGCGRAPVEKAMPYLVQPEDIVAGRPVYYASTCGACTASCGLLLKARDGRPIKLEGNPDHPLSRGGTCAAGQASILGLYDSLRLKQPLSGGQPGTWEHVDAELGAHWEMLRRRGGAVRYLSETVASPTRRAAIERFLKGFRDGRLVEYDPLSCSAILDAHQRTHGLRVLPHYRFAQAEVIASFDADFLGTWIAPVEFARDYGTLRRPPKLSYHAQFESRMSLTGSRADRRVRVAPEEVRGTLERLIARLEGNPSEPDAVLDDVGRRLLAARGRSLVVSGEQDIATQELVNYANELLRNYGATLDIERPSLARRGSDRELARLLEEIAAGQVSALVVDGVNPAYDLPAVKGLERVPLLVSLAQRQDETASLAHYVCPDRHYLESWGDAEAVPGLLTLRQPGVRPLGGARPVLETLARWAGEPRGEYDMVKERWRAEVFPKQRTQTGFDAFWSEALRKGSVEVEFARLRPQPFQRPSATPRATVATGGGYTVVLYPKVGMLDGRYAYNPWLQELPDPITKVTWDNCASLSPAAATALGVGDGDVVRIESLELPVVVQPGQHDRVVAIPLGYGSAASKRFARTGPRWIDWQTSVGDNGMVGKNAAPLLSMADGTLRYTHFGAAIAKTGRRVQLALTQIHHTLQTPRGEARPIVQEVTPAELAAPPEPKEKHEDLWPEDHPSPGHRWGLAVDLNACTGCSACVVACQVENNIPVVGRDEVRRRREMHWIRIDRYYSGPPEDVSVAHQPMMCQHCAHAPCETVCPVLATVHSDEGLNQQVYNRCVGTRYCENNCPYKTRRFNWFNYPREDALANLVLNPDVTVRSRGVMEKCSMCVQRIQYAKIESRRTGQPIRDGDIQTACQQACPTGAIVFGDLHDPASRVAQLARDRRGYQVLEEVNVQSSVEYLKVIRQEVERG